MSGYQCRQQYPQQPISPYHDPQRPIPYRGPPIHPPQSIHSRDPSLNQQAPLDPASGGWDAPGPLLQERARRGSRSSRAVRQRSTGNWVNNPAQPPYGRPPLDAHEARSVPRHVEHSFPGFTIGEISFPQPPVGNIRALEESETVEPTALNDTTSLMPVNQDGWPEISPSPTPVGTVQAPDAPIAAFSPSSSSIEVVVDPISTEASPSSSGVEREVLLDDPPTFVPAKHGDAGGPGRYQPAMYDPNVLNVVNPRQWGVSETDENAGEDGPTISPPASPATVRPDSAPPIPPPVTAYVSDEDESVAVESFEPDAPSAEGASEGGPDLEASSAKQPLRPSIDAIEVAGIPLADNATDTTVRNKRQNRYRGPGATGAWWKKDPHPAYAQESADKRVMVKFPHPVRLEAIKPMMTDHFSKYGAVRCVFHHDATPESAEKAIVVFTSAGSIDACFADPQRTRCVSRFNRNQTHMEIQIERPATRALARTIFIKFTGPRVESGGRPDSSSITHAGESPVIGDYRPLPKQITVWAFPQRPRKANRVDWWARVVIGQSPEAFLVDKAREVSGQEPVLLDTIDLRRRVPESQIVPRLCEYFADLVDIPPPTNRDQGWLICVSGQRDAERVMNEIGRIPGVTARWATDADGLDTASTPSRSPRSPMGRYEKYAGDRVARALKQWPRDTLSPPPMTHHSGSIPPLTPPPSPPVQKVDLPSEYPHLRKLLAPTYKGRLLQDSRDPDGEVRYTDVSAIFVGRLVKEQETEVSLFQRFARYGPICAIEYRPDNAKTTYATARILYADPDSAARAIHFEDGAVSFGCALKVQLRKVLPVDVRMKELYMDDLGRPISPSMVSQYSPPSIAIPPISMPSPAMPQAPFPDGLPVPPGPVDPGLRPNAHLGPAGSAQFWPVYLGDPTTPGVPQPAPMFARPPCPPPPILSDRATPVGTEHPYPPTPLHNVGYMPVYPQHPMLSPVTPLVSQLSNHQLRAPPSIGIQEHPVEHSGEPNDTASPPSFPHNLDPPQSPMAPKIVGYKSENGVFKVVYDTEELRRFQAENGISKSPPQTHGISGTLTPPPPIEPLLERPHTSPGQARSRAADPPIRRGSLAPQRAVPVPIPFIKTESYSHGEPYSHHAARAQGRQGSTAHAPTSVEGHDHQGVPVADFYKPQESQKRD